MSVTFQNAIKGRRSRLPTPLQSLVVAQKMARFDADLRVVPGSACLDVNSALPAQQLRLNVKQSWTASYSKLRGDTDRSDADRYVSDVTQRVIRLNA